MVLIYLHQYFTFPDEVGGTRSYDLATSFRRHDIDIKVISSTSDRAFKTSKLWTVIKRDNIEVHYIFIPYSNEFGFIRRVIAFLKFLWFSTFRLLKLKADLIIATSTPLTIGIPAMIKKWYDRTPFIFETRDVWPEAVIAIGAIKNRLVKRILFLLEKTIYNKSSAIVPLSTDMQYSITTRYPSLYEKSSVVIENISEINRFQRGEIIDFKEILGFSPRFTVLYAGTFGRVNGLDYVVSLAELTLPIDPSVVFIIVGNGSEKSKIISLAKEKNVLKKNLFVLDSVKKDQLPNLYKSVNMGSSFVIDIKELWANSANKFFDTLAAGKPVLINHEGWQSSTIRERNLGYVLPANLSFKVASDFVAYTNDYKKIEQQSKNSLKTAIDCYSLRVATDKYIALFKKVLNNV